MPRHEIRILVSFEAGFYAYQGALAAAIRILRPDAEVTTVEPEKISGAAKRFGPDLVIASRPEEVEIGGVAAWVELSLDPTQATRVRLDEDYSEMVNPTLDKLLAIIDEVVKFGRKEVAGEHERPDRTPERGNLIEPSAPAKDRFA